MRRSLLVTLVVVGVAIAGAGAYLVRGELRCNALEDDYVNAAAAMRSNVALREMPDRGGSLNDAIDVMQEDELSKAEAAMSRLYVECGDRAAETAQRKGTGALFGR